MTLPKTLVAVCCNGAVRVVHLYPFVPSGRHGGTLRLAAAVEAAGAIGSPEVHCFDAAAEGWLHLSSELLAAGLDERDESRPPPPESLKRRLFPSTLWESGSRARRALDGYADRLRIDADALVVLHTSYLAAATHGVAALARATVVDVYDLVWRAHRNDAGSAGAPLSAIRWGYSESVRWRESRELKLPDALLVAGYDDYSRLSGRLPAVSWVPTATPVEAVPAPAPADGLLRVGLLGNFAHASTRRSADQLLASALAADPSVRVLLAGLHASAVAAPSTVTEVLGAVSRAEDFYARVDCVVAPVEGGSGIKCKLGEALLAGRPVITTPLGAAGYPPSIRRHFTICATHELDAEVVRRAVAGFDAEVVRAAAQGELGHGAVVGRYAAALADAVERPARSPHSAAPRGPR